MSPNQVWVYLFLFRSSGEKVYLPKTSGRGVCCDWPNLSHGSILEPITAATGWDVVTGLNQSGPTGSWYAVYPTSHGLGNVGSWQEGGRDWVPRGSPPMSATTGHWRTMDKGPMQVPLSTQQNLLETACSVREEVVEHRKGVGGESPIKAISSTSCPSGQPGALGWGQPPLAGTQGLPGTLGQLETN